jgi:hypothetical protein
MKFKSSIARAAMTALFIGASAQATIINTYTSSGSMPAPSVAIGNENFDVAAPGGFTSNYNTTSAGLPRSGVNYLGFYNESTTAGHMTYRSPGTSDPDEIGSGGLMLGGASAIFTGLTTGDVHGLRVSFGSIPNITSLSFNYSAYRSSGLTNIYSTTLAPITLRLEVYEAGDWVTSTGTASLPVPVGTSVAGFFGFTTTGNISGIKLYINAPSGTDTNLVILDNLAWATAAEAAGGGGTGGAGEIPEPSSYLLCAAGLFGAALIRRKSK